VRGYRSGDGACAAQVAGLHVAARHAVVHQHLLQRPVHVPQVGVGQHGGLRSAGRLDSNGEVDVNGATLVGLVEVGQWRRVLFRPGAAEGRQGVHGHNPRRDGRAEVLGSKRTERDVLPRLDVASCEV